MHQDQPQEAFHAWLAESFANAWKAIFQPERAYPYLEGAADHADLERRMRVLDRRSLTSYLG